MTVCNRVTPHVLLETKCKTKEKKIVSRRRSASLSRCQGLQEALPASGNRGSKCVAMPGSARAMESSTAKTATAWNLMRGV